MNLRRAALTTALLVPAFSGAQSRIPGGPYAPIVLLLPAGARTLALGNTGIVSRDDDVLFFNPAQLAVARGMSASGERYSSSAGGGALSSVTRFNTGGIAVGMRSASYDGPFLSLFPSDRGTMVLSGPSRGTSLEASVGVAQVFKGVRVGAAAKYVEDDFVGSRVSRPAFDLGLSKDLLRFYSIGLAVQNIGPSTDIACFAASSGHGSDCTTPPGSQSPGLFQNTSVLLPFRTTLGGSASRSIGELDVVATAAIGMIRTDYFTPSGGLEVGYSWLDGYSIAFRAGGRRPLPGEAAVTAGAGFTMDRLSIDYALETLSAGRIGNRIGLRIR